MVHDITSILSTTEILMKEFKVNIRDTWAGYYKDNADDFYFNGNKYNGPKSIRITIKEDGRCEMKANKVYEISNFTSVAYDNYEIIIPKRLSSFTHPLIHETVHFLQHNTLNEDKNYIQFNGDNYYQYVSQRTELEAHFIQLKYIEKYELEMLNVETKIQQEFKEKISRMNLFNEDAINIILYSKEKGII